MARSERQQFIRGAGLTSLGGLVSRILGMGRDVATAALFGTASGVLDCFVFGFQIPQFVRRLFGDGAQSAAYLPILSERLESNRDDAWRLATANMWLWFLVSVAFTALGIGGCLIGLYFSPPGSLAGLAFWLAAIFLPYLVFLSLTAQIASTLHAMGKFGLAVICTLWVNVVWLVAAVWWIPTVSSESASQATLLAVVIVAASAGQAFLVCAALLRTGFRFRRPMTPLRENQDIRRIVRQFLPSVLGMGTAQTNAFIDTMIGWLFTATVIGGTQLGRGAVSALYLGERLFMFPVGLIGQAIGTAIYPLLSRHAARGEVTRVCDDMVLGLRIVLTWGVPASLGLVAMGRPIAVALYRGGEFTLLDAQRTGLTVACYGGGVWAFCALAVLVRGCYAMNDFRLPMRWGLIAIGTNVVLNFALVVPLRESGLAIATAVAASLQAVGLAWSFSRRYGPLTWDSLVPVLVRVIMASILAIGVACYFTQVLPEAIDRSSASYHVLVAIGVSLPVYLIALRTVGISPWRDLRGHGE